MNIISLLSNDNYIIYNKDIAKEFGIMSAVLLGELCSWYSFLKKNNALDNDTFYVTRETIEKDTGLTADNQRTAQKRLVEAGIITVIRKGVPAKNHYRLNLKKMVDFFEKEDEKVAQNQKTSQLSENPTSCNSKSRQLDVEKTDIINIYNNNKKENNNNINIFSFSEEKEPSSQTNLTVVDNQIKKAVYKWRNGDSEDIIENRYSAVRKLFLYFYLVYKQRFQADHPHLKNETIETVCINLDMILYDYSFEEWQSIIRLYFDTKFKIECNYSIAHFANQNLINNLAWKIGLEVVYEPLND